jgi:N-acetylglucosamine-6-phosphate deacetylase
MPEQELVIRGVVLGDSMPSDILVKNGRVESIQPSAKGGRADVGSENAHIAPTLFDIQINGGFGIDLQGENVSVEDVHKLNELLAREGVSHWAPTLITGSAESMEHGCRVLAEAMRDEAIARSVPGIHLEGPYISPEDGPRGAHSPEQVRKPDLAELERFMAAAEGKVLYMTISPELENAPAFIAGASERGIVVSLGHHAASPEQIEAAAAAGARMCTHLGNGMAAQVHRHHNALWPQLVDDRLAASFIADLEHLPPQVLKAFVRCKGAKNTIITSDIVHIAGLEPGEYHLMGIDVELQPSGRICLSGTDYLAGSSLMLLQAVVNAASVTELTMKQAFDSATTIPAKLLGLKPAALKGPREEQPANFLVFRLDEAEPAPKVQLDAVFIGGERKK